MDQRTHSGGTGASCRISPHFVCSGSHGEGGTASCLDYAICARTGRDSEAGARDSRAQPPDGIDIEGGKFRAYLVEVAREGLEKMQREAGTALDTIVEDGDVAPVVRSSAEEQQADLVVIGRGVLQEMFGRMRTHVYSVIREAPCPVISV